MIQLQTSHLHWQSSLGSLSREYARQVVCIEWLQGMYQLRQGDFLYLLALQGLLPRGGCDVLVENNSLRRKNKNSF